MNLFAEQKTPERAVYRLTTEYYKGSRGLCMLKSLNFLSSKGLEHDVLQEEIDAMGSQEALLSVKNLNSCDDGLYYLTPKNMSKCPETGIPDIWDWKLEEFSKDDATAGE